MRQGEVGGCTRRPETGVCLRVIECENDLEKKNLGPKDIY